MKHLHKYVNLNEAEKSPVPSAPSAVTPIGFILYIRSRWYYGAFPTFHDFAGRVFEDFTGYDVETEFFGDIGHLKGSFFSSFESNGEGGDMVSSDIDSMNFWWGATPKCASNILLDLYCYGDPYKAASELDLAFSGLKPLMSKWRNGMDSDPGFIGLSIANNPSQLDRYMEYAETEDAYFDRDDILDSIKTGSKELQALVKYHKIKKFI